MGLIKELYWVFDHRNFKSCFFFVCFVFFFQDIILVYITLLESWSSFFLLSHHPWIRGHIRWKGGCQRLDGELRPSIKQARSAPAWNAPPHPPTVPAFITHQPASADLISLANKFRVLASPVLNCSKVLPKKDTHTQNSGTLDVRQHFYNWVFSALIARQIFGV